MKRKAKFRVGQVLFGLSRDFTGGFVKLDAVVKSEEGELLWKTDRGFFHESELHKLNRRERGSDRRRERGAVAGK